MAARAAGVGGEGDLPSDIVGARIGLHAVVPGWRVHVARLIALNEDVSEVNAEVDGVGHGCSVHWNLDP